MTKSKTKKQSILNLNTFLNNNTKKKTSKHKSYTPKLTPISLNSLEKQYKLELYKDTITSFYALNNPITSYLVKYDDDESKRLIKNRINDV